MNQTRAHPDMETSVDLYVSPHLDDAVLSCGGRIAAAVRECHSAIVVTALGAPTPLRPVTRFACTYHETMGILNAPFRRRQEDRAALRILGARPVHLEHLDCIYRIRPDGSPLVKQEPDIFRFNDAEDRELVKAVATDLAELITRTSPDTIFVPLALGWHRDHVLTRRAAERAVQRVGGKARIRYFEEIPYAIEAPHALADATWGMSTEVFLLTEAEMAARLEATSRYASQSAMLWHEGDGLYRAIRRYSSRVGDGMAAERYWYREE